jgi:hypothetical protein
MVFLSAVLRFFLWVAEGDFFADFAGFFEGGGAEMGCFLMVNSW